jgi:hypothetical protein
MRERKPCCPVFLWSDLDNKLPGIERKTERLQWFIRVAEGMGLMPNLLLLSFARNF